MPPEKLFDSDPPKVSHLIEGTSLTNSMLSAALAASRTDDNSVSASVLHVDSNDFYGSFDATLRPREFDRIAASNSTLQNFKISQEDETWKLLDNRKFNLDLKPTLFFASDEFTDILIKAGFEETLSFCEMKKILYVEISSDQTTFSELLEIPLSKSAVFKSPLTLQEKRSLMKFLNSSVKSLAFQSAASIGHDRFHEHPEKGTEEISGGSLEFPSWNAFLASFSFSARLKNMVNRGVLLLSEDDPSLLTYKEGLAKVDRFARSIGRFGDCPLLYPQYGSSELLQAFCRRSAVYGSLFALGVGYNENESCLTTGDKIGPEVKIRKEDILNRVYRILAVVKTSESNTESQFIVSNRNLRVLKLGPASLCCPENFAVYHFIYSNEADSNAVNALADKLLREHAIVFRSEFELSTDFGEFLIDDEYLRKVKDIFKSLTGDKQWPFM
jgi:GDP dissociation inhibitor